MYFLFWNIISLVVPEAEINANHALITSMTFMFLIAIVYETVHTLCPQKTCDYIVYNNFNNRCPITIIFIIVSSKSMRHRKMVSFPTF